jgi:hypothetical protein
VAVTQFGGSRAVAGGNNPVLCGSRYGQYGIRSKSLFNWPAPVCGSLNPSILYVSETTTVRSIDLSPKYVSAFAGDLQIGGFIMDHVWIKKQFCCTHKHTEEEKVFRLASSFRSFSCTSAR